MHELLCEEAKLQQQPLPLYAAPSNGMSLHVCCASSGHMHGGPHGQISNWDLPLFWKKCMHELLQHRQQCMHSRKACCCRQPLATARLQVAGAWVAACSFTSCIPQCSARAHTQYQNA